MIPMAEACAECTQNCFLMHKKDKNPSSVATSFFKVMFDDDHSKILLLPPRFARSAQKMVGKVTSLEDLNGEKWPVTFTKIDGVLAFKEGWNAFYLAHGLKPGDLLVFHYIMDSHFVVLMYGQSGCSEIRHYGCTQPQKEKNPSSVTHMNSNGHWHNDRKNKQKGVDSRTPPRANPTNTHNHLFASSSRPVPFERTHKSKPSVRSTDPDKMVSKTPTAKQFHLMDDDSEEDAHGRNCVNDLSVPEVNLYKSNDRQKSDVVGSGENASTINKRGKVLDTPSKESKEKPKQNTIYKPGKVLDTPSKDSKEKPKQNTINKPGKVFETQSKELKESPIHKSGKVLETQSKELKESTTNISGKVLETPFKESSQKPKEKTVDKSGKVLETQSEESKGGTMMPSETKCSNSIKKRLRGTDLPIITVSRQKMAKKDSIEASKADTLGSRLQDASGPSASTVIGTILKPTVKPMEGTKKEVKPNHGLEGVSQTLNCGLEGWKLKDAKMSFLMKVKEEDVDMLATVKPEPVDYNEAPPPGAVNASFSAVMSSYRYLELPEWVELKSKVILLRNGRDLWPVLYQKKAGLRALTQNWKLYARERGIQPGDKCEFVLETEAESRFSCYVFRVNVTCG